MASMLWEAVFFNSFLQSPWISVTASILAFRSTGERATTFRGLAAGRYLPSWPKVRSQLANFAS